MSLSSLLRHSLVLSVALFACKKTTSKTDEAGSNGSSATGTQPNAASEVVSKLLAAAPRIRTGVAQSRAQLTVAERTDMMAAWAAVDTAAKLSVLWRDRTSSAGVDAHLASSVEQLSKDIDQMLGERTEAQRPARAEAVYDDAIAVAQQFAIGAPRHSAPGLPPVTHDSCAKRADAVIADLGGIATSELLLATTRPGYPWVTLTPPAMLAKTDAAHLIRPAWLPPLGPGAANPQELELARALPTAPQQVTAVTAEVKKQVAAATAGPPALAQVGALVDGYRSGARARAATLSTGKPMSIALHPSATAADAALASAKRELEACALASDAGTDRARTVTALTMLAAFGAPGASCAAGQNTCEPGTTCSAGQCVPWCGSCPAGDTCVEGRCEFPLIPCEATADCALYPNTTCSGGECVQTCGATTCGRDQTCTLSCVPRPTCGVCQPGQYCDGDTAAACENGPAERQCSNDADCKAPPSVPAQATPRCVSVASDSGTPINMCIGIGWACRGPNDCGPGTECDAAIGQCVDRETYSCNATNKCRNVEGCVLNTGGAQRCEVKTPAIGQPCDATGAGGALVYGECRKGTWQDAGHGAQKCMPGAPHAEVCDNLDNDCDGVVDNAVPSHDCNAQAPGTCAHGHSTCTAGSEQCLPGTPTQEICDGQDNDCNGTPDDIAPLPCPASAPGDCGRGTTACSNGQSACNASAPNGEVCDGRDNDCNGAIDDLKTQHSAPVSDIPWSEQGLFGISDNKLFGTADCGGERDTASATRISGDHSHCEVVDWADIVCQDPNRKVGNSTVKDACNTFFQQGGHAGNNSHDCRYIVHFGTAGNDQIVCQMAHVVTVPDHCP